MNSAAENAALDRIDADRIVAATSALVAEPSINPGGYEAGAVEVLARLCRDAGLSVEITEVSPGRPNLVARTPDFGGGPGLLLLGHSDVVPPGPGWTGDPFVTRQEGDRLIGRGTTDMKGGLAAAIEAMRAVIAAAESGTELSGPITLVAAVDEEEHGTGTRAFVEQARAEDYLGCIVAEPTSLTVVRACRGASYVEVDVSGQAAHSGRPSDGRNAILTAAQIIELLNRDDERMAAQPDPLLGPGNWNVGTISGGQSISIVAPDCSLGVDRRLLPDERAEQVAARLREDIDAAGLTGDGVSVDVRVTMELPGFATPADEPLVAMTAEAVRGLGRSGAVGGWTASCDGGVISRALGIPTLVCGPGDINGQAHQPDESVAVLDLVDAAKAYTLIALRRLGG